MTDTQPVDLSTLEQGDTVVFSNKKTAFIGLVAKCKYQGIGDGFRLDFFAENCRGSVVYFHDNYFKDGRLMLLENTNHEIIEIIKNPKRWTDEDMKVAFDESVRQMHKKGFTDFDEWLEQYKESKK